MTTGKLPKWLKDKNLWEIKRKPSERILPLGYSIIEAKRRKLKKTKKRRNK